MSPPAFERRIVDRLRDEIEVSIETRPAPDGPIHRTIIWVVVDAGGRVLIRSYRGASARWYREALSGSDVAVVVDGERVPVTVEPATDAERIAACSAELERKYAGDPATPAMLRDEVLDTTLELHLA
jgi:hypothetical protein